MVESLRPARLAGRTFRFSWTAGPTAGKTHEHVFHTDGSVSYAPVEQGRPLRSTSEKQYGGYEISEDVVLVSYQSSSGYTLTVAMNFRDHRLQGFASGAKDCALPGATARPAGCGRSPTRAPPRRCFRRGGPRCRR